MGAAPFSPKEAIVAITITRSLRGPFTLRRSKAVRATLGTYATGGVTVTAAELGVPRFEEAPIVQATTAHGYVLKSIPVSPAVNGTFTSFKIMAFRVGALDGNAASAGPLTEVANAVDLSAVGVAIYCITR